MRAFAMTLRRPMSRATHDPSDFPSATSRSVSLTLAVAWTTTGQEALGPDRDRARNRVNASAGDQPYDRAVRTPSSRGLVRYRADVCFGDRSGALADCHGRARRWITRIVDAEARRPVAVVGRTDRGSRPACCVAISSNPDRRVHRVSAGRDHRALAIGLRRAGRASSMSPGWRGTPPNLSALARPARSGTGVVLPLSQRPDWEHGPAIGGLTQLRQGQIEGACRGGEAGVAAPVDQGGVGPIVARAE